MAAPMKLSAAILKGMEQHKHGYRRGLVSPDGRRACALGCANFAVYGDAITFGMWGRERTLFEEEFGIDLTEANDGGIPREDIAGMLMAIGE